LERLLVIRLEEVVHLNLFEDKKILIRIFIDSSRLLKDTYEDSLSILKGPI